MDIALNEVVYFDGIASNSTGAAVDADSTPTFEVFEEATDTDIGVGGNMTKRTSKTGHYRGSFTISAANGFEVGKFYSVVGTAVVGGVTVKGVLMEFRCSAAEAVVGAILSTIDAAGMDAVLIDGKTFREAMRIIAATTAGMLSGAGTGTEEFLGLDKATPRVTATVDSAGNRTSITYG